ncbi:hypothetical protein M5689_009996 [Euphorbia peplus]|nr:hypothetical protein M5689_009996 [Euphorbia peplus]
MSNSDHLFLLKQDINKHHIHFNLLPIPDFKFPDTLLPRHQISNSDPNSINISQKQEDKEDEESRGQLSLGQLNATEDNNQDGFKTPDHKIPELKQCPPAPRKPIPKRKRSEGGNVAARRSLRFDLSEEFESLLFPRVILAHFNRNINKSRTEN